MSMLAKQDGEVVEVGNWVVAFRVLRWPAPGVIENHILRISQVSWDIEVLYCLSFPSQSDIEMW